MTSIGPISPASLINPASAPQSAGTQGARHHDHHQPTASDPDGDGIPDAPSSSASAASPASALSSALNTTA